MLHPGWVKTDIGDTIDEWMAINAPGLKQLTTADSAAGCVRVIQSTKSDEATVFLNENGETRPW